MASKERHFSPLANILENRRDAIPLGRYGLGHTPVGIIQNERFF
jgi:hypothetical protein